MGYPWLDGQILTAADLNAEFASLLGASSPGGIFWVDSQAFGGDIQAAINAAQAASGGIVWLGPHDYTLGTSTITCDLSKGVSIRGFGPVTRLLCQNITASTPVFSFTNGAEATIALSDMQLCAFNTGKSNAPVNTGGAGHSDFVTNSQAIKFDLTAFSSVRNVRFWNFDRTTVWGTGGSIFSIDFDNCAFGGCNKGWCIDTSPTNSFERMTVRRSSLSGCNYGAYIVCPDIGGSFWIENCSIDFNAIREVYYQGATVNTQLQSLHVCRNHMETSDACSGTSVSRSFCQGTIIFTDNHFFENGPSGPPGFVDLSASSASFGKFNGNSQSSPNNVPYALTTAGQAFVSGVGNTTQQPQEVILSRSGDGDVAGESLPSDQYLFVSGFTPHSDLEAQRRVHYLSFGSSGAGTSGSPYLWNIDPDSSTKHAIGSIIRLYNVGTAFWTVTPGTGVTLSLDSPLASATFSATGAKFELIKTAANTWRMHQV